MIKSTIIGCGTVPGTLVVMLFESYETDILTHWSMCHELVNICSTGVSQKTLIRELY